MTPIDELLDRTLLLKRPTPRDVIPYEDLYAPPPPTDAMPWPSTTRGPAGDIAAHDLQTLCEAVVTYTATDLMGDFLTEQLPEPRGARVLGCILQLTDAEGGARFWWQYAAGAGDDAASYCLYLHHLSLGETTAADWWRKQTSLDTRPTPETVILRCDPDPAADLELDSSTPTVLRVLGRLLRRAKRPRTEAVDAVMDYVPGAVALGYLGNPDFEIPLPGPDFADHIAVILAAASAINTVRGSLPHRASTSPRLSQRDSPMRSRAGRTEHSCPKSPQADQAVHGGHR